MNEGRKQPSPFFTQQERWDAIEHEAIGTEAFEVLLANNEELREALGGYLDYRPDADPPIVRLKLSSSREEDFWLTPGEIMALAGDFYGTPHRPISEGVSRAEQMGRFYEAYTALMIDPDKKEVDEIKAVIRKEKYAILKALDKGRQASAGLEHSDVTVKGNVKYTWITYHPFRDGAFSSRYLELLKCNTDHFAEEALVAYRTGHDAAIEMAELASKTDDALLKSEYLVKALAHVLFAGHFLSDRFSAGHIRTPRRQLIDKFRREFPEDESKALGAAGWCSNIMHDEDNEKGLWVTSGKMALWKAYGDAYYFNNENEDNKRQVHNSILTALQDIVDVFNGDGASYQYMDYVPYEAEGENLETNALFLLDTDTGEIKLRKDFRDPKCVDYYGSREWSYETIKNEISTFNKLADKGRQWIVETAIDVAEDIVESVKTKKEAATSAVKAPFRFFGFTSLEETSTEPEKVNCKQLREDLKKLGNMTSCRCTHTK